MWKRIFGFGWKCSKTQHEDKFWLKFPNEINSFLFPMFETQDLLFSSKTQDLNFFVWNSRSNFSFKNHRSCIQKFQYSYFFSGNSARALFKRLDLLHRLTKIPIPVLEGIRNIWICIRIKYYLNPDKFHHYVQHVKDLWLAAIPWYPICPTCHKVYWCY